MAEPFLVRAGLLARTPRGRVATPAAWTHLGMTPPRRVSHPATLELFADEPEPPEASDAS